MGVRPTFRLSDSCWRSNIRNQFQMTKQLQTPDASVEQRPKSRLKPAHGRAERLRSTESRRLRLLRLGSPHAPLCRAKINDKLLQRAEQAAARGLRRVFAKIGGNLLQTRIGSCHGGLQGSDGRLLGTRKAAKLIHKVLPISTTARVAAGTGLGGHNGTARRSPRS